MAAGKSSRINRQYKTKYRIRHWREYERGLRSRGDVTIWLSEDAIAAWIPPKNGLRGGQRRYSNLAIRTALTLRVVFGLPLRQTEGFLDSLLSLMSRDLKAPDHTTLSRRNQIVVVPPLTRSHDGPIDLIVDSTGLKILGRGEWNAHKHKTSQKRRDWRKLHIGVDAKGFIVAAELTASSRDDASTLPDIVVNATKLRTGSAFRFGSRQSGGWRFGTITSKAEAVLGSVLLTLGFIPFIHGRGP